VKNFQVLLSLILILAQCSPNKPTRPNAPDEFKESSGSAPTEETLLLSEIERLQPSNASGETLKQTLKTIYSDHSLSPEERLRILALYLEDADPVVVVAYIEHGRIKEMIDQPILNESTLLVQACRRGDVAIVQALLKKGANPNEAAIRGTSEFVYPLNTAVFQGQAKIVKLLLEYGAGVNRTKEEKGYGGRTRRTTVLDEAKFYADIALASGSIEDEQAIVTLLQQYGAKTYDELGRIDSNN